MNRKYIILFVISLVICGVVWFRLPYLDTSYSTLECSSSNNIKLQQFESRYCKYSEKEKNIIKNHVNIALNSINRRNDEFVIAAAINDYVFQYYLNKNNIGNPPKLLNDGYAICGGAAVTMTEMLYSVGIKSKLAFLIGIPRQGAHSMVEVVLGNGQRGLFDPTFGLYYYDSDAGKPISIYSLLEKPELCKTTIYQTKNSKRKHLDDNITPMVSLDSTYIRPVQFVHDYYDPYESFLNRQGGGCANDRIKSFVKIELAPGMTLGSKEWSIEETSSPWSKLAVQKNNRGDYISWAYMLGQTLGYDIAHILYITGLENGKKYNIEIGYAKSYGDSMLSYQFGAANPAATQYKTIENVSFDKHSYKTNRLLIEFEAVGEHDTLVINVDGIMILTSYSLMTN